MTDLEQARMRSLEEHLERGAPTAYQGVPAFPSADPVPQVYGEGLLSTPRRGHGIPYRTHTGGYRVTPAFYETLPVTYQGRPLWQMDDLQDLEKGTAFYIVFHTEWHGRNTYTATGFPDTVWHYLTGARTLRGAELHVVPPGKPAPESTDFYSESIDPEGLTTTNRQVKYLGFIDEDEEGRPFVNLLNNEPGHYWMGRLFTLLHLNTP